MLEFLLTLLPIVPIIGFIGTLLIPKNWERTIFSLAIVTAAIEFVLFLLVGYQWLSTGAYAINASLGTIFATHDYRFALDFYFDATSAIFLGMTTLVAGLVFIFSKYYLHREPGFKRFYTTVLLFLTGLSLIVLSGNFEVLFLGWELIGISSILLIAFYRDRMLPARNALKVFSVYRIADAFLLAAVLYAHHLFEKNIQFSELSTLAVQHGNQITFLGLLLLMVALIKSAQFPFSYWLPRAMEGPTTSSAIFYGALSVHMGVFLLLRTSPLWEGDILLRILIVFTGLLTAIVATSIARVQSSIKTQIAYASITQIGIMFIEIALGLHWLALIHFVSNAALRAYQLLISPSVVGYLVHDQFFYFVPPLQKIKDTFFGKMHATFYVLGTKEWNMNTAMSHYLWKPFKTIGYSLAFLDKALIQGLFLAFFLGLTAVAVRLRLLDSIMLMIPIVSSVTSVLFFMRAYATKGSVAMTWNLIMLGNLFGALALSSSSMEGWDYVGMYIGGVLVAFLAGHGCLWYLKKKDEANTLREYQGAIYAFPKLGNLFFVITLLLIAFPVSPSFIAQDVLLSLISNNSIVMVVLFCLGYLLLGISAIRLYVKLFFGPHKTSLHERAYKSS